MDRCGCRRMSGRAGVPRPRGDGPRLRVSPCRQAECSPPARGWTGRWWITNSGLGVFPARAGMDRTEGACVLHIRGVPRPRGDGPQRCHQKAIEAKCSPPARGWTDQDSLIADNCRVFPARAGMDRTGGVGLRRAGGVPRPRGDGPLPRFPGLSGAPCSPPARGWTESRHRAAPDRRVFPARAGMDRRWCRTGGRTGSVPRPRGDGP